MEGGRLPPAVDDGDWMLLGEALDRVQAVLANRKVARAAIMERLRAGMFQAVARAVVVTENIGPALQPPTQAAQQKIDHAKSVGRFAVLGEGFWPMLKKSRRNRLACSWTRNMLVIEMPNIGFVRLSDGATQNVLPGQRVLAYEVQLSAQQVNELLTNRAFIDAWRAQDPTRSKNRDRITMNEHQWDQVLAPFKELAERGDLELHAKLGDLSSRGFKATLAKMIGERCLALFDQTPHLTTLKRKAAKLIELNNTPPIVNTPA